MEKQTKILLGVGAVIAAYLILKPKKVAAQTDVVENVKNNGGYDGSGINPYGMYSRTPDYVRTPQEIEACNQDPFNCKM
jgi:hypothetical protein